MNRRNEEYSDKRDSRESGLDMFDEISNFVVHPSVKMYENFAFSEINSKYFYFCGKSERVVDNTY